MTDKLWDAFWKIVGQLWDAKRKPEHKGKRFWQFFKDWRAENKRKHEEYKKLPFKTKLKLFFTDLGKKLGIMFISSMGGAIVVIILSKLGFFE